LHVAQSAISQQLATLEDELQVQLFIRHASGVTLTDPGKSLKRHAQVILHHLELAKAEVTNKASGPSGPVSIGIPPVLTSILGLPLFEALRSKFPNVALSIVDNYSSQLRERLKSGELDIGLLFTADDEKNIDVQQVLTEELFYLTTRSTAQRVSLNEVARHPLILAGRDSASRDFVIAALKEHAVDVKAIGEIDSKETLIGAVASGMASTILPWSATYGDENGKKIRVVPIVEPLSRPISICIPRLAARRSATDAVASTLISCISELVGSGKWPGAKLVTRAEQCLIPC
jgi:LysR family nitrogen assimilation transcriptional regulator